MPSRDQIILEVIKAGLAPFALTIGAFLTTVFWSGMQKRRELQIAAADAFHKLYGEFFAVWKLWNAVHAGEVLPKNDPALRWELFDRAAKAESGVEAILVRLVSERRLETDDPDMLARFRQGYQTLREHIRENIPIPWFESEHPEYLSFKSLACSVASLLSSRLSLLPPNAVDAGKALRKITSNELEGRWVLEEFKEGWKQTPGGWIRQ